VRAPWRLVRLDDEKARGRERRAVGDNRREKRIYAVVTRNRTDVHVIRVRHNVDVEAVVVCQLYRLQHLFEHGDLAEDTVDVCRCAPFGMEPPRDVCHQRRPLRPCGALRLDVFEEPRVQAPRDPRVGVFVDRRPVPVKDEDAARGHGDTCMIRNDNNEIEIDAVTGTSERRKQGKNCVIKGGKSIKPAVFAIIGVSRGENRGRSTSVRVPSKQLSPRNVSFRAR